MAIQRFEIGDALKELITYEEGMKFQALAVVLAKLKWNDLVASEWKNDLGLDAWVSAAAADDHVGKGLACSITPKLSKITADAEKAHKHFNDISLLIFATPNKVANPKKLEWSEAIRRKFGYELVVISREEIITQLTMPENAALCRSFLGMNVAVPERIEESLSHIRQATGDVAKEWEARLQGLPLIQLRARRLAPSGESSDTFGLADIHAPLKESRRVVLVAPAGRGKTTTLIQLARYLDGKGEGSSFLIDLPAWVASRTDILSFIAGMAPFLSRSIDVEKLAQAQPVEHFSFLLNGWNEVAESESHHAINALQDLERTFPAAGIIVATRTHHIAPPLPGAMTLRLLELTRRQRREYLHDRLGDRASDLTIILDGDPLLDDLTKTPFILSEVASLFDAGVAIPASKIGVLREVVRLLEQSHEHSGHLQAAPLRGASQVYLSPLATAATAQGTVSIDEAEARMIVNSATQDLIARGQIATPPEPAILINTLCAHHVLERTDYPKVTFRFAHQQFQEYYAAVGIRRTLEQALQSGSAEERRAFARAYLNEPAWAEPLRMIAEAIGVESVAVTATGESTVRLGALLVNLALEVDLVFTAELSRLCGERVWVEIGPATIERLLAWYSARDENHRQCALTGMVASGSDAFKDILVPLLTAEHRQVRLWGDFQLSSLGKNWQSVVRGWTEKARMEFVEEILFQRFVPELVSFAMSDDSKKVRQAAINGLEWLGVEDEVVRIVNELNPDEADRVLLASAKHGSLVPDVMKPRTLAAVRKHFEDNSEASERIRALLQMAELGDVSIADRLKEELNKMRGEDMDCGEHALREAIEIVRRSDAAFVSRWIAERVADGVLWPDPWMSFVQTIPDDLAELCLHRLETDNLKRFGGLLAVLGATATPAMAKRVFDGIRGLRVAMVAAPKEQHKRESYIARNLETLFRACSADTTISGLSSLLKGDVDAVDLEVVSGLFSDVARHDDERLASVSPEMGRELRGYLKKAMPTVLREDDFRGELKANVAAALALVGEPEDVADLEMLARADIERMKAGRAAPVRGESGEQARAAHTSYAHWHVHALTHLGTAEADDLLLELLKESEYERFVCEELARRASPKTDEPLAQKVEYVRIWDARENLAHKSDAKSRRYADALRARIAILHGERAKTAESQPDHRSMRERQEQALYDNRLRQLGNALAAVDSVRSAGLVLELMALPGEWAGWTRVEAAERLLFNGVVLPAAPTLSLLDPTLNRQAGLQNQERSLVNRFLCICPYVDRPTEGFRKMREILPKVSLHDMREVATAVGYSRSDEALEFLHDLASDRTRLRDMEDAWVDAVAAIDTQESRELLLSFVDSELSGLSGNEVKVERKDVLVAHIVDIARRDPAVERRLLQLCRLNPTGQRRELLAMIVGWLSTSEALLAGLSLIDDTLKPSVPGPLKRHLQAVFVEHRRIEAFSPTFSHVARNSNVLRLELCRMAASDEKRRVGAFGLVGAIEVWRLEYGRPSGEPRNPLFESGMPWPLTEPTTVPAPENRV